MSHESFVVGVGDRAYFSGIFKFPAYNVTHQWRSNPKSIIPAMPNITTKFYAHQPFDELPLVGVARRHASSVYIPSKTTGPILTNFCDNHLVY